MSDLQEENIGALKAGAGEGDIDAFKKDKQRYSHKERMFVQKERLINSIGLFAVIVTLLITLGVVLLLPSYSESIKSDIIKTLSIALSITIGYAFGRSTGR